MYSTYPTCLHTSVCSQVEDIQFGFEAAFDVVAINILLEKLFLIGLVLISLKHFVNFSNYRNISK